ncbi:MAG: hypothetical protein LBB59_07930 [Campylobacteraceae bacterium]|nr:hypothetical protein [Campylobacteraceae bacterium]
MGEEFSFPEGVGIGDGGITTPRHTSSSYYFPKTADSVDAPNFNAISVTGGYDAARGSGGSYVLLLFTLTNNNNVDKEVVFPAGLVAISTTGIAQNGLLIKRLPLRFLPTEVSK